jgi:hypothetical protein
MPLEEFETAISVFERPRTYEFKPHGH